MGLNVYFCDVCGVRVTDVDLRSGHGMLRSHDVICATCLEMGHGKEWLSARGGDVSLVGAASASSALGSRNGHTHLLDHARDRAATVEDESGETGIAHEPVQGQLVAHEEPEVRQLDHEDTGLVDSVPADFSGAAAGFAALSQSSVRNESDDADGNVDEDAPDEVDPMLLHATPPFEHRSGDEHQASPFSVSSADDDDSSALINVTKPSHSARSASRSSASGKKGRNDSSRKSASRGTPSSSRITAAASSSASNKKESSNSSVSQSNSGSGKISKSKTSRSGRRPASGMPSHLKIALITVPLILLIAVVVVLGRGAGSAKQGDVKDLKAQQSQISRNFTEAQRLVNDAWMSKDVAQMKAADTRWKQFMQEWDQFSSDTKKYSGWTDENCSEYWEGLHAPDVYNRTRLLRDEIVKQANH